MMNTKAVVLVALLAALLIQDTQGWGWVKKTVRTVHRVWRKYPVVRYVVKKTIKSWDGIKTLRSMDEAEFRKAMSKMENDLSEELSDDTVADFMQAIEEIVNLSDGELQHVLKMESNTQDEDSADVELMLDSLQRHTSH
uniref:uncharacterized protein LOC120339621 n=1 Tax=Styela clava TaxID=7725 RepID=UPI00193AA4DF|nr:uncharacterized protein LOC120339621 [Styela clava]